MPCLMPALIVTSAQAIPALPRQSEIVCPPHGSPCHRVRLPLQRLQPLNRDVVRSISAHTGPRAPSSSARHEDASRLSPGSPSSSHVADVLPSTHPPSASGSRRARAAREESTFHASLLERRGSMRRSPLTVVRRGPRGPVRRHIVCIRGGGEWRIADTAAVRRRYARCHSIVILRGERHRRGWRDNMAAGEREVARRSGGGWGRGMAKKP